MKSKRKDTPPKYIGGGLLAASIAQGALGAGQAAFGFSQRAAAKRMIEELQRNQPSLQIPTALRRLVNEPIAEEYMEAQEMGAQRRTAQNIDTLGKLGSRGIGAMSSTLENERIGEQQRAGQYEQARRSALGQMAGAEQNIQNMQFQNYLNEINAARGALEAGQQNIFGGFGQVARGASQVGADYLTGGVGGDILSQTTFGDIQQAPRVTGMQPRGVNRSFEEGGALKTKGVFSHRKNPKDLIDRNTGEVEAELTGDETVFNKEQSDKMEALANAGKDKELRKFVKNTFKKFKSKRKNG